MSADAAHLHPRKHHVQFFPDTTNALAEATAITTQAAWKQGRALPAMTQGSEREGRGLSTQTLGAALCR